jgi:hypothetical protein
LSRPSHPSLNEPSRLDNSSRESGRVNSANSMSMSLIFFRPLWSVDPLPIVATWLLFSVGLDSVMIGLRTETQPNSFCTAGLSEMYLKKVGNTGRQTTRNPNVSSGSAHFPMSAPRYVWSIAE